MTQTIRLTAAQAMVRYLTAQLTEDGEPFIAGVWAIFGHGNVAGIGEALYASRDAIPTWRGHNEQTMAHAAIAYAKQLRRKRAMAVTSSIGPGAANMVTAAGLAHVNRLPVLLLPGDQPGLAADAITTVIGAVDPDVPIAVTRYDDGIGHPFWFARSMFDELRGLGGDKAA